VETSNKYTVEEGAVPPICAGKWWHACSSALTRVVVCLFPTHTNLWLHSSHFVQSAQTEHNFGHCYFACSFADGVPFFNECPHVRLKPRVDQRPDVAFPTASHENADRR